MDTALPDLVPPAPRETADLVMPDGAVIRLRRHGNPAGPRIALSHGNGLAMQGYFPFWALLLDRYDVILFDCRSHGENPLHDFEQHTWASLERDMAAIYDGIARTFGPKRCAGAFHSMASVAALGQTLKGGYGASGFWDPLILVDIPIFPRPGHPLVAMESEAMRAMGLLARRRPDRFESPEAFARGIVDHPAFAKWVTGAHLLFAKATLRPDTERGDWALVCPRHYEAHIYETNIDSSLWVNIGDAPVPIGLIGSTPAGDFRNSPGMLAEALADDTGLPYVLVPDTTHFMQIEKPDICVDALEQLLRPYGMAAPAGG